MTVERSGCGAGRRREDEEHRRAQRPARERPEGKWEWYDVVAGRREGPWRGEPLSLSAAVMLQLRATHTAAMLLMLLCCYAAMLLCCCALSVCVHPPPPSTTHPTSTSTCTPPTSLHHLPPDATQRSRPAPVSAAQHVLFCLLLPSDPSPPPGPPTCPSPQRCVMNLFNRHATLKPLKAHKAGKRSELHEYRYCDPPCARCSASPAREHQR